MPGLDLDVPLADSSQQDVGDGLAERAMQSAAASVEVQEGPAGKQVSLSAAAPALVPAGCNSAAAAASAAGMVAAGAARPPLLSAPGPEAADSGGSRATFSASSTAEDIRQGRYGTLDEPVRETIMRDVRSIAEKIQYVMNPQARHERAARLQDWDLWGPLILCLALGVMLSAQALDNDQASYAFADIFFIVWGGSAVVTLNAVLLRGRVSFFQSVCVLGYCMCPLVIAAFACMILDWTWMTTWIFKTWVKFLAVGGGTVWSTGASVGYMSQFVPEDRTALAVFPVWLFYIVIAWMILLA